ncbi:MAG: hypothetical protein RDV48_27535 [Candidatus Eremiobacteraeota bacterium]|nr:hypothetical protein [Candidatus Eremiobacteraeota bacterium]
MAGAATLRDEKAPVEKGAGDAPGAEEHPDECRMGAEATAGAPEGDEKPRGASLLDSLKNGLGGQVQAALGKLQERPAGEKGRSLLPSPGPEPAMKPRFLPQDPAASMKQEGSKPEAQRGEASTDQQTSQSTSNIATDAMKIAKNIGANPASLVESALKIKQGIESGDPLKALTSGDSLAGNIGTLLKSADGAGSIAEFAKNYAGLGKDGILSMKNAGQFTDDILNAAKSPAGGLLSKAGSLFGVAGGALGIANGLNEMKEGKTLDGYLDCKAGIFSAAATVFPPAAIGALYTSGFKALHEWNPALAEQVGRLSPMTGADMQYSKAIDNFKNGNVLEGLDNICTATAYNMPVFGPVMGITQEAMQPVISQTRKQMVDRVAKAVSSTF